MTFTSNGIVLQGMPFILASIASVLLVMAAMVYFSIMRDQRPRHPERPGQRVVMDAIWHGLFGVERFKWWKFSTRNNRPPAVDWVTGDRLEHEGKAFYVTWDLDGRGPKPAEKAPVLGIATPGGREILVAMPHGSKMAGSPLVHELYHQCLELTTGDPDAAHTDSAFSDPNGKIAQAEALLVRMGV